MELYTNNPTTNLNGTINNSTTTVVVNNASSFPATGNFRILIDNEIMEVTAVSSNTFTVVRGAEGTSATSHTTGVQVDGIITKATLDNFRSDSAQVGASSSVPTAGFAGLQYFANDWPVHYHDNGASFDQFGPSNFLHAPPQGGWTNRNHSNNGSTTTVTTDTGSGSVFLTDTGSSGQHLRGYTRTRPVGNYTITIGVNLQLLWDGTNFHNAGMLLFDGTNCIVFGVCANGVGVGGLAGQWVVFVGHKTSVNGGTSSVNTFGLFPDGPYYWFQIIEGSSFRTYKWAIDGQNYLQFYQETNNTFLTTTDCGIYVEQGGTAAPIGLSLFSFTAA